MVVRQPKTAQIRRGLTITQLTVADDTAQLRLTFFNYPYAAQALEYGREYRFYGVLKGDFTGYAMQNPQFEPLEGPQLVTGRILPVYSRTAGLPASLLRSTVNRALEICLPTLPEVLPEAVLQTYDLCSAREAYQCIHNPPDFDQLARARRRVVFEEFFLFSAGLLYLRQSRNKTPATAFTVLELSPFLEKLPYAPTGAQRRAMDDIRADLGRGDVALYRAVEDPRGDRAQGHRVADEHHAEHANEHEADEQHRDRNELPAKPCEHGRLRAKDLEPVPEHPKRGYLHRGPYVGELLPEERNVRLNRVL